MVVKRQREPKETGLPHRLCGSPCAANGLMVSRVPAAADLEEEQPILWWILWDSCWCGRRE